MNPDEAILLVDDDQELLDACRRRLRKRFLLETRSSPEDGLAALERTPRYAVVVSDMHMPGMLGVQFLAQVRARSPESIRMMLTGHADLETAVGAVNTGNVFRFLTKPCSSEHLAEALEAGLQQFRLVRDRFELQHEKLRHAQQMELVGQCAAGVLHDLRNILALIRCYSDLALETAGSPGPVARALRQIQTAADDAARLSRQLIDLGKPQAGVQFERLGVGEFLAESLELLRRILPDKIKIDLDSSLAADPIRADSGMLGQVLLNLVLNARDAMPDGGKLAVKAESIVVAPGSIRTGGRARAGRFVRISVADTGCGMDEETRGHLFTPFFTTKADGGTGLGLTVVANIVAQHEGWLEVESAPGRGTSFHLYLPQWDQAAAQSPMETADGSPQTHPVRR